MGFGAKAEDEADGEAAKLPADASKQAADARMASAQEGDPTPTTAEVPADASVADASPGESPRAPDASVDAATRFDVVGPWRGHLVDAANGEYEVCVLVTQAESVDDAGKSTYMGTANCSCDLMYLGLAGTVYSFAETPSGGRGCWRGTLRLTPNPDGTLDYQWFTNAGDIPDIIGTLSRAEQCPS